MLTKQWIEDNCFTVSGNLNNRSTIKSWWSIRGFDRELEYIEDQIASNQYQSITQALYHIYHQCKESLCKICGGPSTFLNFKSGYRYICSQQCSYNNPERAIKIHTGRDYQLVSSKRKQTCVQRYGVESTSKLTINKSRDTKLERYGDPNYNNREKQKVTLMERYGVESASLIPSKIEKTIQLRTEKIPLLRDKEALAKLNETHTMAEIAASIGVHETAVAYWFRQHDLRANTHYRIGKSKPQQEIYEFCQKLVNDVVLNDTTILYPKEIDVLIDSKKVGIEMNGVYWHKERPTAHIEKTELMFEQGYRLLHFWDIEWYQKRKICESIIKNALGLSQKIAARKCTVVEVSNRQYRDFCNNNHIHGYAAASIRLGLEYNDQLVMVIGIGKSRYNKNFEYEIVRSCSLIDHTIVGGFQRLLKHSGVDSILSYCDQRFYVGTSYKQAGFKHLYNTPPNYFYWSDKHREAKSRIACQKHKLQHILDKYDSHLTEHQNMLNNQWYRVYDCGNMVWYLDGS